MVWVFNDQFSEQTFKWLYEIWYTVEVCDDTLYNVLSLFNNY